FSDEARNYFRVNSGRRRPKRQAYQNKYEFPRSLWKDGVYYSFHRNLNSDARREVDSAVRFWQENTCIKFYKTNDPNNAPVKPVLNFFPGQGCSSRMGRDPNGAIQYINLEPGQCEHELKESMRPIPGGLPPSIPEINMRKGLEEVLIEGDIVMTPDEARNYFRVNSGGRRPKRQAYQNKYEFPRSLWKDGVYYSFHRNLNSDARREVDIAVKFWQENTCIKFYKTNDPNNAPVKPVLNFFPGQGCSSRMGRDPNGAIQYINLEPGQCEHFEVVTHEIAHALGFMHEQSRWDRDEYVWIDTNKVSGNMQHNYDKEDEEENNNYGMQYDFGGVMHYQDNFFAINQRDTVMHARNPDYQLSLGAAIGPMYGDVYEMNMLYSCYDRCKDSGTVCKNEGMPNPNNCKVCQCPSGFEGNDCSQRQSSSHGLTCGETLAAGADWKTLESTGVVGAGNYDSRQGNRSDPYRCTWHITAPEGKVIEYEVTFIGTKNQRDDMLCYPVCYFGGLKIKGQEKTWKPEGMKLCCAKQLNKIRTTVSNLMIIDAYNHLLYTDFSLKYRIKDDGQPPVSTKSTPPVSTESTPPVSTESTSPVSTESTPESTKSTTTTTTNGTITTTTPSGRSTGY
uniref:Zinc metalloproteinase n=1 Tax=Steinernema glaseri TaxID=37863 RepID=A0A1I7ZIY8_9BILA